MKKMLLKSIVAMLLCPAVISIGGDTTHAAELNNHNTEMVLEDSLNNNTINLDDNANQYIHFDRQSKQFIIDNKITTTMSGEEFAELVKQIEQTNKQIKTALVESDRNTVISVVDTDGLETVVKPSMTRGAGKNYIKFYATYARIGINAGSLNLAIQGGFAIGGIYAPARVVQAALAVAGVAISAKPFKHGVWFDYNYFVGFLIGRAGLQ